jgi:predicted DNA-binding transcriptional regulator AlpA
MERRLLGIEELGEYIGIKPQTIRNRLSLGTFPTPAKKICGRVKFEKKEVEKYIEKLKPITALTPSPDSGILSPKKGGGVSEGFPILPVPSG